MKCEYCGKEVDMPFKCPYCGGLFCADHRLPENHDCPKLHLARRPLKGTSVELKPPLMSRVELRDLMITSLVMFALALSSSYGLYPSAYVLVPSLIVASSYLAHEFAHKLTAMRLRLRSRFVIDRFGLILTLVSVLMPIKFIAPGAVVTDAPLSSKEAGKVGMAGPVASIVLASLFYLFFRLGCLEFYVPFCFNSFISIFSLLPFGSFDGRFLFEWNKLAWVACLVPSVILIGLITWL